MIRDRRAERFLLAYALASAGEMVAYAPLLSLLLPTPIAAVAGTARVEWLGLATLLGALSASVFDVLIGWVDDLRGPAAAGPRAA